jgi:hypothetical protein
MAIKPLIFVFASVILSTNILAKEGFYLGPEVGRGSIKINSTYSFDSNGDSRNDLGFGGLVGYEFDFPLSIEANYYRSHTDSYFSINDSYEIKQTKFLIGYGIPLNSKLRLVPKLGLSQWDFSSKEGSINSGPPDRASINGSKVFAQLNLDMQFSKLLNLNVSYSNIKFDFGRASSINASLRFHF